jgi:hypothetical protein
VKLTSRLAIFAVSFAIAIGVSRLSHVRTPSGLDDSVVRLSWRTQGVSVEECRRLTEEELERIAPHMRRPEECTGGVADYELVVTLDDDVRVIDTIGPSGVRRDRPVYVFYDLGVDPGTYSVAVRFAALVPPGTAPSVLEWAGQMKLEANEVGLITTDPTGTELLRR